MFTMRLLWELLATSVMLIHLAWILWVIFGAFFTRGRPWLAVFHVASLLYGILIETLQFYCPLTHLEQYFQLKAGVQPYSGDFIGHYVEKLIYPDVPQYVLTTTGLAVCLLNLLVYFLRYRRTGSLWGTPSARLDSPT